MTNSKKTVSVEDQLSALQAKETSINLFLDLPVFKILSQLPSVLNTSVFIVSKDNKSVFNGTESIFRTNKDLTLDLVLPDPIAITKPVKTDFAVELDYYKAIAEYSDTRDDDNHPINVFNKIVSSLTQKITTFDLSNLYSNFRRAVDFVVSCDPSQFISNDPLEPNQLPSEIKAKILAIVRKHFAERPYIVGKGKVQIELPQQAITVTNTKGDVLGSAIPNLDSSLNVEAYKSFRREYPYSQSGFYGKEVYFEIMNSIYKDLNCFETIDNLARILDVDYGSSKNTDTILTSIIKELS